MGKRRGALSYAMAALIVLTCAAIVQMALVRESSMEVFVSMPGSRPVALTFDTSLSDDKTEEILDVLKEKHTKATFAVCGIWAKEHPETLKRIIDEKHDVISHTMHHEDYSKMPPEDILQDAAEIRQLLSDAGVNTMRLRPAYPLGEDASQVLRSAGYELIGCTVDSQDWKKSDDAAVEKQVLSGITEGSIVLFQTDEDVTVRVLSSIIDALKVRNYAPVTLSEMGT